MTGTTVAVPEAVMEKVHAELCRAILDTPDYIQKVVGDLLKEPKQSHWQDNDPDKSHPLFERILRRELRRMIEQSMVTALRERYQPVIDATVVTAMQAHQQVDGSLAYAFAKIIQEDWKVKMDVNFAFERND